MPKLFGDQTLNVTFKLLIKKGGNMKYILTLIALLAALQIGIHRGRQLEREEGLAEEGSDLYNCQLNNDCDDTAFMAKGE